MQLKDYLVRTKTLNKEAINTVLHNKLSEMYDSEDMRGVQVSFYLMVQKCLYIIEFSISNKITEIKDYFFKNFAMLTELKENLGMSNKKVLELVDNILVLLGKNEPKPKANTVKPNFINPKSKQPESFSLIEQLQIQPTVEKKAEVLEEFDPFGFGSNMNNPVSTNSGFSSSLTNVYPSNDDFSKKNVSEPSTSGFSFVKKAKQTTDKIEQFDDVTDFTKLDIKPKETKQEGFGFIKKKENYDSVNQPVIAELNVDTQNLISASESNAKKTVSIDDIISMAYGGDSNQQPTQNNLNNSNFQVPINYNQQPPQNIPSNYQGYTAYQPQQPNYGYPQQQYQPYYQPQYIPQPQSYGYQMNPSQQIPWQHGAQFQPSQDQGYQAAQINTSDYNSSNVNVNDKLKDKFNFLDDMLKIKK